MLEQCLRTVEPLVRVALVKEFDGGLPSMYVDEDKLRRIVLNLLSNAAKFTERGTIRLKAQADNGSVAIAVADTGIGIPGDKLGLIFEEFEQVDASINRAHGGTGLGLAIAQRLARLMGGDIGVESTLGSGSTFTLTLPLRYSGREGNVTDRRRRAGEPGPARAGAGRRRLPHPLGGQRRAGDRDRAEGETRPDPARRDDGRDRRLRSVPAAEGGDGHAADPGDLPAPR